MNQRIGLILSFIGVLTVITHGSMHELRHLNIALGDGLIMAANLCWSLYSVLGKRLFNQQFAPNHHSDDQLVGAVMLMLCASYDLNIDSLLNQSWNIYYAFILYGILWLGHNVSILELWTNPLRCECNPPL